jgi:hypothetical protein
MNEILKTAKLHKGLHLSPIHKSLGCVEAFTNLLDRCKIFLKERMSTIRLYQELIKDSRFEEIKEPEAGCIILTVTQGRRNGHVGIVSDDSKVFSNNSRTFLWDDHYTLWTWRWRYTKFLRLQTKYYRYKKDAHIEQLEKQVITLQQKLVVLLQSLTIALKEKIMTKKLGSKDVKMWYDSKEIWVAVFGIGNYLLNYFGLPSFEPTPAFYTALITVLGALRLWFTESKLALRQ